MYPSNHLRFATDAIHKPPVLEQLWVKVHDEQIERLALWTAKELLEYYGEDRCEWRKVATEYLTPSL